jgi:hypothetical protein
VGRNQCRTCERTCAGRFCSPACRAAWERTRAPRGSGEHVLRRPLSHYAELALLAEARRPLTAAPPLPRPLPQPETPPP